MIGNENILSLFLTCIYADFQKRSNKPFDMFSLNIITELPLIICEKICVSYSPISNKIDLNTFILIIKKLFFCFHFEEKLTLLTNIVDYKHKSFISKHNIKLIFTHLHTHIINYYKKEILDDIINDFFEHNEEVSFTEFYRKSKSSNPNLVYIFSILIDKYNFGNQKEQLQLFNETIFEGEEDINEYIHNNYSIENISKNAMIYANIIKHETKQKHSDYISNILQCNDNINNDLNELDYFEKDLSETVNTCFNKTDNTFKYNNKNHFSQSTYYGSSNIQTEDNTNAYSSSLSEENQHITKLLHFLTQKPKHYSLINTSSSLSQHSHKYKSALRIFNNPLQSISHSIHNVLFCYKSNKSKHFHKVKLIHIDSFIFYFKHSSSLCTSPKKDEPKLSNATDHSKYTLKRIIHIKQLFISIMQYPLKKDYFQLQLLSNIKQNKLVKHFYSQNEKLLQSFKRKVYKCQRERYRMIEEVYGIGQEVGYGQFGHVFKGVHRETSMTVSIKVVNKNELIQRSSMNISFWGKDVFAFLMNCNNNKDDNIKETNIVKCYDYFENPDKIFYVMEYIPHGTIKDYINDNNGELNMKQVNTITKQLVNGISFLHGNGIIHRDIKLTNALISKGNEKDDIKVKLIDFGLSRVITQDEWIKTNSGTFIYKAPEIIFGNSYTLNADIWSLGVCVYYMIFGNYPIEEKDKKVFREKLLKDNFNFFEKVLMKTPKGINHSDLGIKVIFGALVKDPIKRVNIEKLLKLLNNY